MMDAQLPRAGPACLAILRIAIGLLWIQNVAWKLPPDFGRGTKSGLFLFTGYAVEYPVLAPWAWFVKTLVLPNFVFFGWLTLLVEAGLGAFLLVGLATRLWALIGVAQTLAITLSSLNAPHEWHWTYFLMLLAHLVIFGTAAGRYWGVDGVLRAVWSRGSDPVSRLLARVS
ncbi:TQO small subunit DoxD [Nonomuraea sp. NPDC050536]|uniref:TQO small subunit DoxD n=1 Tax=Nonomuraea sp. NPDC050536 TaxID=3364366 RepID=UPI0037C80E30